MKKKFKIIISGILLVACAVGLFFCLNIDNTEIDNKLNNDIIENTEISLKINNKKIKNPATIQDIIDADGKTKDIIFSLNENENETIDFFFGDIKNTISVAVTGAEEGLLNFAKIRSVSTTEDIIKINNKITIGSTIENIQSEFKNHKITHQDSEDLLTGLTILTCYDSNYLMTFNITDGKVNEIIVNFKNKNG